MRQARLVRKRFRAWLEAQAPRKVVGKAQYCRACPLAKYFNHLGEPDVRVYPSGVIRSGGYRNRQRFPKWAREFVLSVDTRKSGAPITAKRALAILDETG